MILADTSVWVEHLTRRNARLAALLDEGAVACHPWVIGELACGRIRARREVLGLLSALPSAAVADEEELLAFIDRRRLHGRGLGWVDVQLLAAAMISGCRLWTFDKPLLLAAAELGVGAGNEIEG